MIPRVDWSLYALTPEAPDREALERLVVEALESGVSAVQVRRKRACTRDLVEETRRIVARARAFGVPVIVNDRVDVALAVGAHGVHLGQGDLPIKEARRMAPDLIIGVSTHDVAQASRAERQGATYVAVGPVYESASKVTGPPVGLAGVSAARAAVRVPLVAVGGIGPEHVADVLGAGADGLAVLSGIFETGTVRGRVEAYRAEIARYRSSEEGR